MKRHAFKQSFCLLLVLALCLALPALSPLAHAETEQALLVLVDEDALPDGAADKLQASSQSVLDRVLANTKVCPETRDLLEQGKSVEARLQHSPWGIRALSVLSDGTEIPVTGHAVLEHRGEYLFGGENGYLLYGFQEEGGKTRFYSPVALPKFDLLNGRMPSDTTLYIADTFYQVDENGYIDVDHPAERDELLWARYWRAEFYQGLPLHNHLPHNATLCVEHPYKMDHPEYGQPSTCLEEGWGHFICPCCGAEEDLDLPLGKHDWGKWVVDEAAGSRSRTCKVCQEVQTEALSH